MKVCDRFLVAGTHMLDLSKIRRIINVLIIVTIVFLSRLLNREGIDVLGDILELEAERRGFLRIIRIDPDSTQGVSREKAKAQVDASN